MLAIVAPVDDRRSSDVRQSAADERRPASGEPPPIDARRSVTPPASWHPISTLPDNPFGVARRASPPVAPDNPFAASRASPAGGAFAAAAAATATATRLRSATVPAHNPFAAPPSSLKGNPFRR